MSFCGHLGHTIWCQCHKNNDDAYWFRTMATAAMQGQLSNSHCTMDIMKAVGNCPEIARDAIVKTAALYATALLKAIKESEARG